MSLVEEHQGEGISWLGSNGLIDLFISPKWRKFISDKRKNQKRFLIYSKWKELSLEKYEITNKHFFKSKMKKMNFGQTKIKRSICPKWNYWF